MNLTALEKWVAEALEFEGQVVVRPQNLKKGSSSVTRMMNALKLDAEAVLWAWKPRKMRRGVVPLYLGAFIRNRELDKQILPARLVFKGRHELVTRGKVYSFFSVG